jgi:outer membrane protein TolC
MLIPFVFISKAQDYLDHYLVQAAENNPGLRASFSEYMAAMEKVPQVKALPDPQIAFGYFIQPVETRLGPQQAKISVMQMFPWFGTLGAKEDATAAMARSKYEAFEEARSKLYYEVRSTYFNLYFTDKAIDITSENIGILNSFRKLALARVEAGLASAVDVLRVEMEIADLENQLAMLKDKLAAQRTGFNNLLNTGEEDPVLVPEVLEANVLEFSGTTVLDSIRRKNHQVLQLDLMRSAYQNQEKAAIRTGMPTFSLGIDYRFIGDGTDSQAAVPDAGRNAIVFPMVSITVPLYRKKYRSMVQEAVYLQEATMNRKENKINVLESVYASTEKEYNDAGRRIPLYEAQSDRAEKSMNILESEYATEGKNFEEILRMERQLLKYRLELEKARADQNAAVAFIHYLMGK